MKPDEIARLLAQAIREKVYSPGAALIQDDLARRFQVSRSPVREALRILAADGVVDMPPGGSGATVRVLSKEDLSELYDLRLLIEPQLAPFIIAEARARDVVELGELADAMSAITDVPAWMQLNFTFHARLFELGERPHTEGILKKLLASIQPYSIEHIEKLGGRPQAASEHHEMVDSIREGRADHLAELFRTHLGTGRDRLLASYDAPLGVDPLARLRASAVS